VNPPDGPLIHIGYHKTGSSWLQSQLFRNADAGFWWGGKATDSPVNRLVLASGLDFDKRTVRQSFAAEAAQAAERGLQHVVSLERLSGHPFSGGYDSGEIARRLRTTFPRGRVVVVIREQRSILASTYKQYVGAGGAQPLRLFLEPPVYRRPRAAHFDLRHFEYHRLLGLYVRLFGPANVLALPYEQLRDDPLAFAASIRDFAGVDGPGDALDGIRREAVNVAGRSSAVRATRVVNRLFVRSDVNPLPLIASERLSRAAAWLVRAGGRVTPQAIDRRIERRMHAAISEVAGDRYRESNRIWSEMTGIDLAGHGYDAGRATRSVGAEDQAVALG